MTEAEIGVPLPLEFKELFEQFGPGYFSDYLRIFEDDNGDTDSLLHHWRSLVHWHDRESDQGPAYFAPYEIYSSRRNRGLIQWGLSETEGEFYWLADASTGSADWPLIARTDAGEDWMWFDISTAEFIYRAIADPAFKPITVASADWPPTFHPPGFNTPA